MPASLSSSGGIAAGTTIAVLSIYAMVVTLFALKKHRRKRRSDELEPRPSPPDHHVPIGDTETSPTPTATLPNGISNHSIADIASSERMLGDQSALVNLLYSLTERQAKQGLAFLCCVVSFIIHV